MTLASFSIKIRSSEHMVEAISEHHAELPSVVLEGTKRDFPWYRSFANAVAAGNVNSSISFNHQPNESGLIHIVVQGSSEEIERFNKIREIYDKGKDYFTEEGLSTLIEREIRIQRLRFPI